MNIGKTIRNIATAGMLMAMPYMANAQSLEPKEAEDSRPKFSLDFEVEGTRDSTTVWERFQMDNSDGSGLRVVLQENDSDSDLYRGAVRAFLSNDNVTGHLSVHGLRDGSSSGIALDGDAVLGNGKVRPIVGSLIERLDGANHADVYAGAKVDTDGLIEDVTLTLGIDARGVSGEAVTGIHGELDLSYALGERTGNLMAALSGDDSGSKFGGLGLTLDGNGGFGFRAYGKTDFDGNGKVSLLVGPQVGIGAGSLRALLDRDGIFTQGSRSLLGDDPTDPLGLFLEGRVSPEGIFAVDASYLVVANGKNELSVEGSVFPGRLLGLDNEFAREVFTGYGRNFTTGSNTVHAGFDFDFDGDGPLPPVYNWNSLSFGKDQDPEGYSLLGVYFNF